VSERGRVRGIIRETTVPNVPAVPSLLFEFLRAMSLSNGAPFQSFKAGAGSQFKIRFGGGNFHVSRILETSK
jgi:hypothetical protein